MESEKRKESSDAPMEEAIGSEPLVSFTREQDSSCFIIQLLQDLEDQERNKAWPLLPKNLSSVPMQKCDDCSQGYISSINKKRHECSSKTADEESKSRRILLKKFWDQLSSEDAKEVVSFKNICRENPAGSSMVKVLSDFVQKPGFSRLPHFYIKAGSEILDIIQGEASRFPISSDEFFTLLDYASEKTFLRGSARLTKKNIEDGNLGENIVACSSLLLEEMLVRAWGADTYAVKSSIKKLFEECKAGRIKRTEIFSKRRQDSEGRDVILEGKENVYRNITMPSANACEEKAVMKETNGYSSAQKAVFNSDKKTVDTPSLVPHHPQTDLMESEKRKDSSDTPTDNDTNCFIKFLRASKEQEQNQAWPLLPNNHSSVKVPMQKCDNCPQEYISSINYRRHQCGSKSGDQESAKNRDTLVRFWDKLSPEDAKEVVSFKNISLGEVTGSSIVKALSDLVREPGFSPLPLCYMKAGSEVLDIIQGKACKFPISSEEFFSLLDHASERTFLRGSATKLRSCIFDGNPGTTGLETNNLFAFSSFLLEQSLIDALLAHMAAENLSMKKRLEEEKEASRKSGAKIVEERRQDNEGSDVNLEGKENVNDVNLEGKENVNRNITVLHVNTSEVMKETIANVTDSEKIDADMASDKKPVDTPCPQTDSADVANVDRNSGQTERGHTLNEEEGFVKIRPRRKKRNAIHYSQPPFQPVSYSAPPTPTEKSAVVPPGGCPARATPTVKASDSCSNSLAPATPLPAINFFARTPASKPAVAPTGGSVLRGTPASKHAVPPPGGNVPRCTPAPKHAVPPPGASYVPPGTQASKHAVPPAGVYFLPGTPAPKPVVLPPGSYSSRVSKPVVPSSSSYLSSFPPLKSPDQRMERDNVVWRPKPKPEPKAQSSKADTSDKPPLEGESSQAKAQNEEADKPPLERESSQAEALNEEEADERESSQAEARNEEEADKSLLERESSQAEARNEEEANERGSSRAEARNEEEADEPVIERESSQAEAQNEEEADERESSEAEARNELPRGNLFEILDRSSAVDRAEEFLRQRMNEANAGEHTTVNTEDLPWKLR